MKIKHHYYKSVPQTINNCEKSSIVSSGSFQNTTPLFYVPSYESYSQVDTANIIRIGIEPDLNQMFFHFFTSLCITFKGPYT